MNKIFFDELDSTNLYAKNNIENLEDKSIIYCNKQSLGRGRFNRKWVSSKSDNIYLSFVLKPYFKDVNQAPIINITQYLSLVLAKMLQDYNIEPEIKWPNDVLVNNKKISGILAESIWKNNKFKGIILGIGVNLNLEESDLDLIDQEATSLNLLLNRPINRDSFLDDLVNNFFKNYNKFLTYGFELIKREYLSFLNIIGRKVCVKIINDNVIGIVESLNENGTISVMDENDGYLKIVNIGDLTCLNS